MDITDSLALGGSNTIDLDILLDDGTVFENTGTEVPFELVTLNLYIYR